MNAMTTLPLDSDGWTVADLERLPDGELRYELVDGALLPATSTGRPAATPTRSCSLNRCRSRSDSQI